MSDLLLDRQVSLLAYLTSGAAIFETGDASPHAAIAGIDRALLRLEARFSHQKRMKKIAAVFPRTFELLKPGLDIIVREFAETCPPTATERLVNAHQFYHFLTGHWGRHGSDPAYLPDVAACELACAEVRNAPSPARPPKARAIRDGAVMPSGGDLTPGPIASDRRAIRRHRAARLLRCAFDARPIFEHDPVEARNAEPIQRETRLAIVLDQETDGLQIFELPPAVFMMLSALEDWIDPATLGVPPELDSLLDDLAVCGLIEVRS
jgi:hypothetical protein